MKKNIKRYTLSFLLILTLVFLSACGRSDNIGENDISKDKGKLKVISSFTIITDMAGAVGGDRVEVYNLVPTGTDPHDYEVRPDDIKAATDADILFYNGINLEGGKTGWFFKMADSIGVDERKIYNLNEGVEPRYLTGQKDHEEDINPHSFISPRVGIQMAENLRDALIETDPGNKDIYMENANKYLERLDKIDKEYSKIIKSIPEANRILVTSERAFQYMAEDYGLREGYIWSIDTEDTGTKEQITDLVELLDREKPPYMFLESNVDPKPMETVSRESGVPIYDRPIYSDEIGKKGESVDSYIKFLEYNINIINDGLSE